MFTDIPQKATKIKRKSQLGDNDDAFYATNSLIIY